jgi:hypothetical protein
LEIKGNEMVRTLLSSSQPTTPTEEPKISPSFTKRETLRASSDEANSLVLSAWTEMIGLPADKVAQNPRASKMELRSSFSDGFASVKESKGKERSHLTIGLFRSADGRESMRDTLEPKEFPKDQKETSSTAQISDPPTLARSTPMQLTHDEFNLSKILNKLEHTQSTLKLRYQGSARNLATTTIH